MSELIGITGAYGVLGNIFQEKLTEKNIPYSCFKGDICSKDDIKIWLENHQFTSIIHLAAIVATKEVQEDIKRAEEINIKGTDNIIEILLSFGQNPWFFYASTSHVYQSKDSPIQEEDTINPISEYGRTKYEAEKIINKKYMNYCIGRIFSFYHKTQRKPFLYPSILDRLENENLAKPFNLFGAESIRDFLNAEEVVDIILKLANIKARGIYNIASGKGIKIKEFVQNISKTKLNIENVGEKDYLVANISKLKRELNMA